MKWTRFFAWGCLFMALLLIGLGFVSVFTQSPQWGLFAPGIMFFIAMGTLLAVLSLPHKKDDTTSAIEELIIEVRNQGAATRNLHRRLHAAGFTQAATDQGQAVDPTPTQEHEHEAAALAAEASQESDADLAARVAAEDLARFKAG